jgi:hypothetical protein
VPGSVWFTNRNGARALPVAALRRGPNRSDGPARGARPRRVVRAKPQGQAIGFEIEDARGDRRIQKLGERGAHEAETAADVVVQRLLRAVGYHVPENAIVFVRARRDARRRATRGGGARRDPGAGGARAGRALASAGEPAAAGRADRRGGAGRDAPGRPQRLVPHELRRDLRAQYVVFSWLDHNDVKQHDTLGVWVPAGRGKGVVVAAGDRQPATGNRPPATGNRQPAMRRGNDVEDGPLPVARFF